MRSDLGTALTGPVMRGFRLLGYLMAGIGMGVIAVWIWYL